MQVIFISGGDISAEKVYPAALFKGVRRGVWRPFRDGFQAPFVLSVDSLAGEFGGGGMFSRSWGNNGASRHQRGESENQPASRQTVLENAKTG
ncbi:hypothetical protein HMPREF0762_01062 [Slackia exigua ATCC 700122]|uniref:Uncharacterized protein n=1 Tax=Slackia exigua (strain ATCC 700122 / DSM 15923 / CIP 105133 / JCM 11022 / KCTC 5966 / S-7) TaxID=649764 RepID=D0WGV8_SLAES|nr:hypothetical protein HMPREF0762_01062 [Slackia exigua ATCC 700122]